MENIEDKYQEILENAECLYNRDQVLAAIDQMAEKITAKLSRSNPVVLSVMTGAMIVAGHLAVRLQFPLEMDYIHATRYRGTTRGGDLHWLVEPRIDLKGRTIVIVDDIMDGGLTLASIIDYCKQANAKDVYTAVLVDKRRTREPGVNFEPDFVGLTTPDKYLFGFGLDYEEYLRNAPGIYAVNNA
ncbi:MAG TPA: hypoxanthine-guanine phosphoribosyltransferase [Gammaproteobacteria bacterium]|nr:hypoxanthine-guanine phosphoribosyltransferase [Gammaproteobacteria bacterium]